MRGNPKRHAKSHHVPVSTQDRRSGDYHRRTPIHGLEPWQKSLAHAAFEVVHPDVMRGMAGDEQVAGELVPIERPEAGPGWRRAIGDANDDALRNNILG